MIQKNTFKTYSIYNIQYQSLANMYIIIILKLNIKIMYGYIYIINFQYFPHIQFFLSQQNNQSFNIFLVNKQHNKKIVQFFTRAALYLKRLKKRQKEFWPQAQNDIKFTQKSYKKDEENKNNNNLKYQEYRICNYRLEFCLVLKFQVYNNSTIRMESDIHYIICNENLNELQNYSEITKINHSPSYQEYQQYYPTFQVKEFPNKCQYFDTNQQLNQNYYKQDQNQELEINLIKNQHLLPLQQKLMYQYTDYINKCRKVLNNVQFQSESIKRNRKINISTDNIIYTYIQGNEILNQCEVNKYKQLLIKYKKCQLLIIDLICNIGNDYRDEFLICVYFILEKLQQLKINCNHEEILNNMYNISNQINDKIISENCISNLNFKQYLSQSQELSQNFIRFLQKIIGLMYNIQLNQNIQEYIKFIQETEDNKEISIITDFCFDFKENDECDDHLVIRGPRKARPSFS